MWVESEYEFVQLSTILPTIDQSESCWAIFVSHDRNDCFSRRRSKFGGLDFVDHLVQPRNLLVYIPNGLCTGEDLVKERVGEGFGLFGSKIGVLGHALPEGFQYRDFLLTGAFFRS